MTAIEIMIEADVEAASSHRLGQAFRHMEIVERDDAAHFRLHPEDFRVVGAFGHRKDAEA